MSAITEVAPSCTKCDGRVELEVDFGPDGTGLYARCTECGLAGWVVHR